MTAASWLFVGGLALVLLATIAFAVSTYAAAVRATSHGEPATEFFARLRSLPSDRAEQATWAFLAHRISGAGIFLFLALHVVDVGLFAVSSELYNEVHDLFSSPPMRFFESGLLFAILFHTLNGVRLLLVDLVDLEPTRAAGALVGVVAATALLGVAGSIVILAPVFT